TDGGGTWKKLAGGLPAQTGRIGLAVSASDPKVVMAVVQSYEGGFGPLDDLRSKSGGVFRSENGGETWTRMSAMDPRPFYFSQIRIDPANNQRVYLFGFALLVSDDGGKNFREDLTEKTHPDDHAVAIQPGTVPPPKPPKPEEKNKPPKPQVCQRVLLGTDRDTFYAESQQGEVHRINLQNGEIRRLRPEPAEGQPRYRFNWNSPMIMSRHKPGVIYLGGNCVFRLTDRMEKYSVISPDLTR